MTITDRKQIASEYLKGWFTIDFVAIFPFSIIIKGGDEYSDFVRVARIGRMYKLVKLARLLRVLKIVRQRSKIVKYIREFL